MAVITHDYYCPQIGMATEFRIVLPNETLSEQKPIDSVLYLLSPEGESGLNWLTSTKLNALCDQYHIAAVLVPCLQGCYTNMAYGYRFYDSLKYLPEYIRTYIPGIQSESCSSAVVGVSVGGFAALKWASEEPDVFRAAASFSGQLDPHSVSGKWFTPKRVECLYGTPERAEEIHNDFLSLCKETIQDHLYLLTCEKDPGLSSSCEAAETLGSKALFIRQPETGNWKVWSDALGAFLKWWKGGDF